MESWTVVFLGIIAGATLVMAVVQVGAAVQAARIARRVERLTERLERDIQPHVGHLTEATREAARTVSLATAQIQRVDALVSDAGRHLERTVTHIQTAVAGPARQGVAVLSALRSTVGSIGRRGARRRRPSHTPEDEGLFIG